MDKRLLINRKYNTADYTALPRSWYAPRELLKRFRSVKDVILCDTTSSAGDWSGMIIQELNQHTYLIPFSQSNNWPKAGYTVYTGEVYCSCPGILTVEDINQIIADYYKQ